VDDEIIKLIKSRHDEFGCVKFEDDIGPGDEIVVTDGVFKNIRGIFERNVSNRDRVMILLQAVQFHARVIVDRETLRKV
jgi:transcription antitermination factor NusG